MARNDPQVNFRLPPDLREKLQRASEKSNRTLTAEIVARLEESFPAETPTTTALRAMLDDQLRILYMKQSAGNALTSLDKLKLPKDPAALLDMVDRQAEQMAAYANEERRLRKLFEDAEKLLESRSKSE